MPAHIFRYLDFVALSHLIKGLTFDIGRCAEVLDHALCGLNGQTALPDRMVNWIRAGALAAGPFPTDAEGRIIVDATQTADANGKQAHFATVLRQVERETVPVVFFTMHSPTLNIPMKVELPLRALLVGNPPLAGTYTLYLHALHTDCGKDFVYYGITKRGWNLQFSEHTCAAVAQKSHRLLARTLNDLIEARAAELSGVPDDRPKLAGLISTVCGVGLSREAALELQMEDETAVRSARSSLVSDDIAAGRLVRICDIEIEDDYSWFLVMAQHAPM